jgi:hypothetical protein
MKDQTLGKDSNKNEKGNHANITGVYRINISLAGPY